MSLYMKSLIVAILWVCFSCLVSAQISKGGTFFFRPGWYVGANAGLNWFLAEGFKNDLFSKDIIGWSGGATVGYNFTPIISVRSTLGYATHKWPDTNTADVVFTDPVDSIQSFTSQKMTVDLVINFTSRMAYSHYRSPFDLSIFGGAGVARREKANFANYSTDFFTPVVHGGLQGDFHLSPDVDLNLIVDANFVNENFNGYKSGLKFDMYASLMVGITYHFRANKSLHRYKR